MSKHRKYKDIDMLRICDPLYELSVVNLVQENEILASMAVKDRGVHEFIREILNTFEINRLNFLRQAGLGWLVFPSATHTRYAHSIGTLTLGNFATDKIFVQEGASSCLLRTYLASKGILEEFLFCLLVHDIGHFPFSHILEQNDYLLSHKTESHEKLMLEYLSGKGQKYDALKNKAESQGLKTIYQVVEEHIKKYGKSIDLEVVKELFGDTKNGEMLALSGLIEGTIDLDRIDHYNRDSYFMGLKLANISIKGLLESVIIDLRPSKYEDPCICILEEGEPHAQQLLFSKELLWQKALDIDVIRSYEGMLNEAINCVFKEDPNIERVILMTDEELLCHISGFSSAKEILIRVNTRRPYILAFKKELTAQKDAKKIRERISKIFEKWKEKYGFYNSEFIMSFPPKFGIREHKWLDILIISDGKRMNMQDKNENLINYFNKQNNMRQNTIRFFAKNDETYDKYVKELLELESNLE